MKAAVPSTNLKAVSLTAAMSKTGPPASKTAATSSMIEQRQCQQCAARRAWFGQPTDRAASHAVTRRSVNGLARWPPKTILVRRQSKRARQESCWRAAAGERTRDGWTRRVYQAVALREGCASCAGLDQEVAQWPRRDAREAVMRREAMCTHRPRKRVPENPYTLHRIFKSPRVRGDRK